MVDAFGADELVGESLDVFRLATENDHFEAGFVIEMGVQSGNDELVMIVLKIGKLFGQETGVVIVNESDGANDKRVVGNDDGIDELVADQIAEGLGAVIVTFVGNVRIETAEQGRVDGNADAA